MNLDASRRLRILPIAALAASTACLASCNGPSDILGLDGRLVVQQAIVHEVYQTIFGPWTEGSHPIAAPARSEPSPRPSEGVSAGPQSADAAGVGSKRPALAEIRRQLARLLRTGAIGEASDGDVAENGTSSGIFVQIGSHQLRAAAEAQIGAARTTLASVISGFDVRVNAALVPTQGRFFRVQIGPISSQGAALDLCRSLQKRQQSCFAVAEKLAAPGKATARIALSGEWASIGPGELRGEHLRHEVAEARPPSATTSQAPDAAPLYMTPSLAGVSD